MVEGAQKAGAAAGYSVTYVYTTAPRMGQVDAPPAVWTRREYSHVSFNDISLADHAPEVDSSHSSGLAMTDGEIISHEV